MVYSGVLDWLGCRSKSETCGKQICVLPSTFTGSLRWYQHKLFDGINLVNNLGGGTFLITMTCNPQWPEIQDNLQPWEDVMERLDLTIHVFHMKMQQLLDGITKKHVLGICIGHLYVVEYQKRSLQHCHLVMIMDQWDHLKLSEELDKIIQAVIPDKKEDPELYSLVMKHHLHGPCSPKYCSASGHCRFPFPFEYCNTTLFFKTRKIHWKRPNDSS